MWEKVAAQTHEAWLELRAPECDDDGGSWWKAGVRFDGCIHLSHAGNVPYTPGEAKRSKEAVDDYIHICDVDELIERLQAIRAAALEHFGPDWPH